MFIQIMWLTDLKLLASPSIYVVKQVSNKAYELRKSNIQGKRVNRGGGYGLEFPCEYIFECDSFSCGWLQAKLIKEEFDVHCGGPSKAY